MSLNNLKFIFLVSLIYMSLVGWSSNNWLMIWFIMEFIFLAFVGFALIDVNYGIVELMMKYFITQVFISLIFSGVMIVCLFNLSYCMNFILLLTLFMKLGIFPFYFWIVSVMGKLSWVSFLLMTTFVKLLPLLLLYYLTELVEVNMFLLVSSLAGSIWGLGNIMIQKLLGYSSLVHLCWLILSLSFSIKLFLVYFSCYFVMMASFVFVFNFANIYYVNQFKLCSNKLFVKYFLFFLILSFAGFPPFMGFMVKWMLVNLMLIYNLKVLIFIMVFFSLFSALFYLELFYYFMMMESFGVIWYNNSMSFSFKPFLMLLSFYLVIYFYI